MTRHRITRILSFIALLFLLVVSGDSVYAEPPVHVYQELPTSKGRPRYVPGELVVRFARPSPLAVRSQVLAAYGLTLVETMPGTDFALVRFDPSRKVPEVAAKLAADPAIVSAEPNYYRYAHFEPNDPYVSYQWHFPQIQMNQAWDLSTGQGVIVAVLDTGVAYENYQGFRQAPDLAGTAFVPGYDFVNNDTHPNDDHSHGTHVTGTIAQTTNNGLGVAGIAFNAQIMPLKVLDATGTGTSWNLAEALRWAADRGAQVVNMSLGSPNSSSVELDAVNYAYSRGVTMVASSGNDGVGFVSYPAAYDQVIAVGAVRYDETRTSYSNYGNSLDLVAPGGDTSRDQNGDGYGDGVLQQTFNPNTRDPSDFRYWFFQGTSMAAPHVSGVAALIIAKGIATTPDEVRTVLQSTAKDLGTPGWDPYYGYGLVQAAAALGWNGTLPTATPPPAGPTATPSPTVTPASDYETQVVQLINSERAAQGLPPLTIDSRLVEAARRHSQDMATNNFFDHIGSDGSTPGQRIREAGYSYSRAGETIAGGYSSPSSVVQGWMNSPPHRAILLGDFVHVGVGYVFNPNSRYGHYWTANFASPSGWNPTPTYTPSPTPTLTPTPASPTPSPEECGDLNNDTLVDVRDVTLAAESWRDGSASGADLNGDGVVDIHDIMLIVAQWGVQCVRN